VIQLRNNYDFTACYGVKITLYGSTESLFGAILGSCNPSDGFALERVYLRWDVCKNLKV
jgi:hypothetical protein